MSIDSYTLNALKGQLESGKVVYPIGRDGFIVKSQDPTWIRYGAMPPKGNTTWHRTLLGAIFALPAKAGMPQVDRDQLGVTPPLNDFIQAPDGESEWA